MIKEIKNFSAYLVDSNGNVFSKNYRQTNQTKKIISLSRQQRLF